MPSEIAVPEDVIVVNPDLTAYTRFTLDCKTFDVKTTGVTVTDPAGVYEFEVTAVEVISAGASTRLLVIMRPTVLPATTARTVDLTVSAKTPAAGGGVELSAAVTALFQPRAALTVINSPLRQNLSVTDTGEQSVTFPMSSLGAGVGVSAVSATRGTWQAKRVVYDGTSLTVILVSLNAARKADAEIDDLAGFEGLLVTIDSDSPKPSPKMKVFTEINFD